MATAAPINQLNAAATRLHDRAMHFADHADRISRRDSSGTIRVINLDAIRLYRKAMEHEAQAAKQFRDRAKYEPTRSVLYRSAASLAVMCGEKRMAEKLICEGLAGDPPEEIAGELRTCWKEKEALP